MSELNEQKPSLKKNFVDLPFKHGWGNQRGYGGEDSDASFTPLYKEIRRPQLPSIIATFKTIFDPDCLATLIRNPELSEDLKRKLEEEAGEIIETPDYYRKLISYLKLPPTITEPGWRKLDSRSLLKEKIKNDPAFKAAEIIRQNLIFLLNRFGITEVKIWEWIEEALVSAGYINPREKR
jgi:predicted house-cleaning noncanonical NTP pyrophosphatase (MazG superfamily)